MSRPSKYKPEFADQARKLCELGATDAQLADFFSVAVSTVSLWKVQHPEFSEALKLAKETADRLVEQSLYRRATGYECDETDIRVIGGEVVQTQLRKIYPPDTTAAIFWLKNRRPEQWRDVRDVNLTQKKSVQDFTDDELANIAAGSGGGAAGEAKGGKKPGSVH